MLLAMISIPKLGSHPELFSLHNTVIDGTFDAIAYLLLISIIASRIKTSVSGFNGIIHDLITDVFGGSSRGRDPQLAFCRQKKG
jgi:hypothetical protein